MGEITEALRHGARKAPKERRPRSDEQGAPRMDVPRAPLKPPNFDSREPRPRVLPSPRPTQGFAGRELLSFAQILRAVIRQRVLAAGVFAGIVLLVAVGTFVQTPTYESTAILLVKMGREFRNVSESGDTKLATPVSQVINTEMVILRSQEVIQAVVTSLGLERLYPDLARRAASRAAAAEDEVAAAEGTAAASPEEAAEPPSVVMAGIGGAPQAPADAPEAAEGQQDNAVASRDAERVPISPEASAARRFGSNLRVEAVPDTQVVRISFQHSSPVIAADAVNLLVEHFMERHLWAFGEARATAFLEEQVATYRKQLDEHENALRAFLEEHPRFAVEDVGNVVGRERLKLVAELGSVRRSAAATRREIAHLEQRLSSISRYEYAAPAIEEQIMTATARLSGLTAQEASIRTQVAKYDSELAELPALRKRYDELVRDRASTEHLYANYASKLEEARVSEEMDRQKIANISVLQAGFVPSAPIRPRKMLNLAVGILLAGGLAVLVALFQDTNRRRSR